MGVLRSTQRILIPEMPRKANRRCRQQNIVLDLAFESQNQESPRALPVGVDEAVAEEGSIVTQWEQDDEVQEEYMRSHQGRALSKKLVQAQLLKERKEKEKEERKRAKRF